MSQTTQRRRNRRRVLAFLIPTLAIAGLGAGQLSLALFTDTESVDATFSTGSIILDAARIDALVLTTTAMMPGDSITDDVVVENDGTAQLRYAMTTSSTDGDGLGLRDVLTLTVKTVDLTMPGNCDDFDGTTVLPATTLGPATAGFGSTAAGAQAGDRTLNAASNETLCFRVSLPQATGPGFQGASTTTTFTFAAEQTANNP